MTDETVHHNRRELLLLGIVAAVPVCFAFVRAAEPARAVVSDVAVRVLAASRRPRPPGAGAHSHTQAESWPDVVRVELEVQNTGATAVLLSPGQFRLRVPEALTVMPCAWLHGPAALEPGGVRRTWVEYRAPAGTEPLRLEFTAAGAALPVPLLVGGQTSSAEHPASHS